jgi:type VI protein secretion system component VasF
VSDAPPERGDRAGSIDRLRRLPRWVWVLAAVLLISVLFALLQSGFHLE